MALNKTLNATCDLDGYLFHRMPGDTLEVEIKVKTKWGKYTMFQDTYTHTENTMPGTGQIGEAVCALGGEEHSKGRYIVAMIIQHQKLMFQWDKV